MKILFTTVCNDKYAVGAQVMLYSMRKNIRGFDDCTVKFFHSPGIADLSEKNRSKIQAIAPNVKFQEVDPAKYMPARMPGAGNRAAECKSAYLTLESFAETGYDKVILFDIDMLCIGDISELFDYDVQYGQVGGNTGLVVLGEKYRTEGVYQDLIKMIVDHNGDGMDQGVMNNYFRGREEPIPRIYNDYPLRETTLDTRILHWAHYDHIKPWVVQEWAEKVELFQDVPAYPYPDLKIGNVPIAPDKPYYDLWQKYYEETQAVLNG